MKRQAIDNGGWFDVEAATKYGEETNWDGSNQVSVNTRSQWDHEALYRTAKGSWVLNAWSQRQGSRETWAKIEPADAAAWLIRNIHELPEDLRKFADDAEV